MLDDDTIEQLARRIHEFYLSEQTHRGIAMGVTPAMRPWSDLVDDLRNANRAQARDIETKLATLGWTVAACGGNDEFVLTHEEIETLVQNEHLRWLAERTDSGWTFGSQRDDADKQHPSIVPWPELSDVEKEKDRDTVRRLAAVLASAGLQPVRRQP